MRTLKTGIAIERWKGETWKPLQAVVIDADADGIFAYLMALHCDPDGTVFPGLDAAPVIVEPDRTVLEQKYGKLLDSRSAVAFDCAGRTDQRPFDHHPPEDYPDQCGIKNVAIVTGAYDSNLVVRAVADQAAHWDTRGGGDIFATINRRFKRFRDNPLWRSDPSYRLQAVREALVLARLLFEDWLYWAQQMQEPSLKTAIEAGTIVGKSGERGCIIEHDSLGARDLAQKLGYALSCQITSFGEIAGRPNRRLEGVNTVGMLQDVLRILRSDIARPRGYRYFDEELLAPGTIEGCEEVYFHARGAEITIGGNDRNIGVKPEWDKEYYLKIMTVAITLALDPRRFPKCCPGYSGQHGCIGAECGIYLANLLRCSRQGRI